MGGPDDRELVSRVQAGDRASLDSLGKSIDTTVAIGPEGGFTDEEIALAVEARWQLVDLGPRTLRIETAAVALAARFSL